MWSQESLASVLAKAPDAAGEPIKKIDTAALRELVIRLYWGADIAQDFVTRKPTDQLYYLRSKGRYSIDSFPCTVSSPYCCDAEGAADDCGWVGLVRNDAVASHYKKTTLPVKNYSDSAYNEQPVLLKGYKLDECQLALPTGITAVGDELILTTPPAFAKWGYQFGVYAQEGYFYDTRFVLFDAPLKRVPRYVSLARPAQLAGDDKNDILKQLGKRPRPHFSLARLFRR